MLAEVQLQPLFSVTKVWFDSFWFLREKLIKSSASQPGLVHYMTRHVSSFFSFSLFFNILLSYLMILHLISMFALVLQFCSTFNLSPCFYFCYCSFSSMPIFSSFVSLLFSFWGESYLLCSYAGSSTCLFISLFYFLKKIFLGGGICEADVWVQHGSVRGVTGSETLNASARLTLLTVPGWVRRCARLANDYQAQLSPAGTKS